MSTFFKSAQFVNGPDSGYLLPVELAWNSLGRPSHEWSRCPDTDALCDADSDESERCFHLDRATRGPLYLPSPKLHAYRKLHMVPASDFVYEIGRSPLLAALDWCRPWRLLRAILER